MWGAQAQNRSPGLNEFGGRFHLGRVGQGLKMGRVGFFLLHPHSLLSLCADISLIIGISLFGWARLCPLFFWLIHSCCLVCNITHHLCPMAATDDATHHNQLHIKVAIVGDSEVGKTGLLCTFVNGAFPGEYMPRIADSYDLACHFEERSYMITFWDTNGSSDFDRLRVLCYPDAHVFLLCFSASSQESFDNITTKWIPEVNHHCPTTPMVLICTKTDLRQDQATLEALYTKQGRKPLEHAQGLELSQAIGAITYLETSAKENHGLQNLAFEIIKAARHGPLYPSDAAKPLKRKGGCSLQ